MNDTTITRKPRIGEPVAIIQHSEAAKEWATSPDRAIVFAVTREVSNPDFGKPLPDQPERGADDYEPASPVLDERETIIARVDYTMPDKPNAGLALAYLKRARQSADVAMSWLIETAIGEEGYDALTEELSGYEDPAEAHAILQGVVERVQRVAMGGLDGSGNSPKA